MTDTSSGTIESVLLGMGTHIGASGVAAAAAHIGTAFAEQHET